MQRSSVYAPVVVSFTTTLLLVGIACANPANWLSFTELSPALRSANETDQPAWLASEEEDAQVDTAADETALEASQVLQGLVEDLLGNPPDNREDAELQRVIHLHIDATSVPAHTHLPPPTPAKVRQMDSTLTVAPSALDFGTVQMNETTEFTFTITNKGSQMLICSVTSSLPHSLISEPSLTLAPGASHTITLSFRPNSPGIYLGNAAVRSDGNTMSVSLKAIVKRAS